MTGAEPGPAFPENMGSESGSGASRANGSSAAGPWPLAAATGLGPMPGTDIGESARAVAGELPELPFLPQLPARGVGADPVGRAVALLVDIYAEVVPSGWRISRRPTRDGRRGRDFLAWDLDAVESSAQGAPALKVQICGPWTLGALLEVPSGHRSVTDAGAIADLTTSLAEGLAAHLAEVRRRLPGTSLILQVDEPELPAVLAGSLRTPSGLSTVSAVDPAVVRARLTELLEAVPGVPSVAAVVGSRPPLELIGTAGFDAATVDFLHLTHTATALDPVGDWLNAGRRILAGVLPTSPPAPLNGNAKLAGWARPITEPLTALGFPPAVLAAQVVPTPVAGLESADHAWATRALRLSRDVARLLADGAPEPND